MEAKLQKKMKCQTSNIDVTGRRMSICYAAELPTISKPMQALWRLTALTVCL
jgi:hypothetical protein